MAGTARGLILAAPASGSGKTVLTLALLRHLRERGVRVAPLKAGPDYIDPAFHAAAAGRACLNMDTWAMRPATLAGLAARAGADSELILAEGVMGLFDGAAGAEAGGPGSSADLARFTGWPVVLVVDAKGMGASAAALVQGFAGFQREHSLAGVLFNRVGGARHEALLRAACTPLGLPVLGCVPRDEDLVLPERHLGLVQAGEHAALEAFLARAGEIVGAHIDVGALSGLARVCVRAEDTPQAPVPPLGQSIAVARDLAFAFAYPHVLEGWRAAGAELCFFSPLADEAPPPEAEAVFLPGGYPELHAGRLAGNARFLEGLRGAAARGAVIYGECGGYMVLGQGLTDAEGARHDMAGLLPLETSFARPRRHLGYREVLLLDDGPLGAEGTRFRGHEFHFAEVLGAEGEAPLFRCRDSRGEDRGTTGSRIGSVFGSFLHLVDRVD